MRVNAAILVVLLACSRAPAQTYAWTEDFQGDSLGQFASYPPVEDAGYDPSLTPTTGFGAPGGRALMRVVKPTRAGEQRFGFIRRLDLSTVENGRLGFAYRIDYTRPGDRLEIGIAGANGKRYAAAIPIETGGWHTVQIPMSRLLDGTGQAAPVHTGIEALYLVADLRHADPDVTYRFLIDDLKMAAAQISRGEPLRLTSPATGHPRLFFGPGDRDRLIARTRDPRYAPIWHSLEERARAARNPGDLDRAPAIFAMLDPVNLLPTLPGYFDIITKAGAAIEFNALDAYLTGDPVSLTAAKSALLAVARWNAWAPPWFHAHGQHTYYPAGQLAGQVAFAYDLLYDQLTPDERRLVRDSLREYAIARASREYAQDNRILANTSNWLAHTVGGALIAAAAIWGDTSDPQLAPQANGLLRKFEDHLAASYLADGSYGEGISYQEFDLETTCLALAAIERVFGVNDWERTHVKDSLWYPISTLAQPVSGSLDMGDTHYPGGYSIAPVVARSRDPVFRWYYDHFEHKSLSDFLFADFSIAAQPPPAPGSRYFPEKGNVVFRTGWGEDDAILLYRAGPNFNHNHADQGSFLIRAMGETLAGEAGYADYYKDPYYDSYFKQAIGHNTVLVNHDPESQEIADTLQFAALDSYPRITDVILSPSIDAVSSELQQVYRGYLRRYNRRIVFLKPDCFVIYDDLAANQAPAQFDWLLHIPNRARLKTEGATDLYAGERAALAVRRLLPADALVHVSEGHIPYSIFNPSAPPVPPAQPGVLEFSTKAAASRARFLVVLACARSEQAALSFASRLRPVDAALWAGVETRGDREELLLFRKEEPARETAYGEWSTDAAVWLSRREAGGDTLLAAQTVTTLKRAGRVLFASDRAVSFVADYRGDHVDLAVNAPAPAKLRVARPNGEVAEIQVAAGEQGVSVR